MSVSVPDQLYWYLKNRRVNLSQLVVDLLYNYMGQPEWNEAALSTRAMKLENEIGSVETDLRDKRAELAMVKEMLSKKGKAKEQRQTLLQDFQRMYPTMDSFEKVKTERVAYLLFWVERGLANSVDDLAKLVPEVIQNVERNVG